MFEEFNKSTKSTINERIKDLKALPTKKLEDFAGKDIIPCGFYFANTKYGKWIYLVTDECAVRLPARYVSEFEEIQKDDAKIDAIKAGQLMCADVKQVESQNGQKTWAFTFKDI